jgi:hypothetical protein
MQREQEKSSAASAVARTQHSSFQYHQQISLCKSDASAVFVSVALALCLLTLCIALKAYFAKANTNIPLALL